MVHLGGLGVASLLKADLAHQVCGDVAVADPLPCSSVFALGVFVSPVAFVVLVVFLQVLFAKVSE